MQTKDALVLTLQKQVKGMHVLAVLIKVHAHQEPFREKQKPKKK